MVRWCSEMPKNLKCDLARIISSWAFIAAIIVTAVLCFSAQVYADYGSGRTYSVIEVLFSLDRGVVAANSDFYAPMIIRKALTGYSAMAMPITASFPFVMSFIGERNSGNMQYTISRTSRGKYYISKFITAVTSGGLCTALGVIFFGVCVFILFPNVYPPELTEWAFPNGVLAGLAKKLLSAFIYGATSVLPAFLLCAFCKNPYIVLCFPFMLKFIAETFLKKVQANAWATGNYEATEHIEPFYPDAASQLVDRPVDKTFWVIIAVNVIAAAIALAGFAAIMENRSDRGR